jgi:two-component system KDP operon response regulator KdpE
MTEAVILIVEDDPSLRRSLAATLKTAGYRPLEAGGVAEAKRMRAHHKPDLILLDLGLPDGEGLDFITGVRAEALTPIVVLSARDAEAVKVAALDRGADDYVTKPFGVDEVLARLRAAARHGVQASGSPPVVRSGALAIDLGARVVRKHGAEIDLSPKEFELLAALAARLGAVVRHKELLKAVWGSERADIQYLRVYVAQLRAKVEDDARRPAYVISDPGVGYRLAAI